MKHCGKENCEGKVCQNWPKCKGETIPPWNCAPQPTTAQASVREQDILAAADALVVAANAYHQLTDGTRWVRLNDAIHAYNAAKCGLTVEAYMAKIKGVQV